MADDSSGCHKAQSILHRHIQRYHRGTRYNDSETTDLIAEWQINSHLAIRIKRIGKSREIGTGNKADLFAAVCRHINQDDLPKLFPGFTGENRNRSRMAV